jgi:hypothetical protein
LSAILFKFAAMFRNVGLLRPLKDIWGCTKVHCTLNTSFSKYYVDSKWKVIQAANYQDMNQESNSHHVLLALVFIRVLGVAFYFNFYSHSLKFLIFFPVVYSCVPLGILRENLQNSRWRPLE